METEIIFPISGIKNKNHSNGYAGKPIAEIVVNGFFTVDKKWTVQYWNKAAERLLKVQAADILGKNLWDVFAGLIPLEFYAVYHKAFEKTSPVHFQEYWGEMGAWFDVITYYCDNTLSVSFKSSNRSVDLEHPTNTEQQLQIKTGLYKFVTEVTNDCLWERDLLNKEIFWIDGGHKRIFGYEIENALIPQGFWESLIHPDDTHRVMKDFDMLLTDNKVVKWETEYRFKKADDDYAWVHDRGHIIYEAGQAVRMIGTTLDITEKVVLEKTLASERLGREKDMTLALLGAMEKERLAVNRELLDNINQVLGAAKLFVEMAKEEPVKRKTLLEDSTRHIAEVMGSISRISRSLVPPFIQELGLIKSIKVLTDDASSGGKVQFTTIDSGLSLEDVSDKLQLDIYRIVQQQVNNIIQHADASLASIDLSKYDDEIVLFIADNGMGHDLTENNHGNGIKNIISLANIYDGNVTTLSGQGSGYTLQVILRTNT